MDFASRPWAREEGARFEAGAHDGRLGLQRSGVPLECGARLRGITMYLHTLRELQLLGTDSSPSLHLPAYRPELSALMTVLLNTKSPIQRLRHTLRAPNLVPAERGLLIVDALDALPDGAREAAIVHLFETNAVGYLSPPKAAEVTELYAKVALAPRFSGGMFQRLGEQRAAWIYICEALFPRLDPDDPEDNLQANAVASLVERRRLKTAADALFAFDSFTQAREGLRREPDTELPGASLGAKTYVHYNGLRECMAPGTPAQWKHHGVAVRVDIEAVFRRASPKTLSAELGIDVAQIEARARELPLPDVCLILPSKPEHPLLGDDRLTTLTLLSKRVGSAWIRSQRPELEFARPTEESLSLLVPPQFASQLSLGKRDAS